MMNDAKEAVLTDSPMSVANRKFFQTGNFFQDVSRSSISSMMLRYSRKPM